MAALLTAVTPLVLRADIEEKLNAPDKAYGPWTDGITLPENAKSVRIVKGDAPILIEARDGATRRGSAGEGQMLPLYAVKRGPGCAHAWFEVGPHSWICGDNAELSSSVPIEAQAHTLQGGADGLPYRYYFVAPGGSQGYRRLFDVDVGQPDFQFEGGFAVAILEQRNVGGQPFGKTGNGMWIPMRDIGPTHALDFAGSEIPATVSGIPIGWVVSPSARVFASASSARPTSESLPEFSKVDVLEETGTFEKFTRIGENKWVLSKDLRHPEVSAPPGEVDAASGERWVDVDLNTQTLVLYQGEKPIFATIISSGRGRQGAYNATPIGKNRVWAKLTTSNMDNLEDENANRYYRMESVPWVQFFSKGVGLHGAFWHRSFGHVRSHGCVNLAPRDAEHLFYQTSPRLPAGWTAVLPIGDEQGTMVRVR